MTNKNTGWVNFASSLKTTESTFAQPISGTSLGQGSHQDVIISGIEPGNGDNPSMKITWEKDGASKTDFVFFLNYDKNGPSNQYLALATSLCSDISLRQEFFNNAAPSNGQLYNCLVGMKANLTIGYKKVKIPEIKYKIKNLNGELYTIVDAFDDETIPDDLPKSFESYQEAKDASVEHGLQLTYLNVLRVTPVKDQEVLDEQVDKLKTALEGPKKPKVVGNDSF